MAAVKRHETPKRQPVIKDSSSGLAEFQPTPGHKLLQKESTSMPTMNGKKNEAAGQYFFHHRRGFKKGIPNFKKRNDEIKMDR